MIRNYFKTAIRSILKRRLFSVINIFGLSIGIAATFLILQYVHFEWSYDKFHKDSNRIYRVLTYRDITSRSVLFPTIHPGVSPALKAEFSEIEESTRVVPQSVYLNDISTWSYTDEKGIDRIFNEEKVYCVDSTFFTVFSFPFLSGNPATALVTPSSVIISESIAKKYFGNDEAVGKTLMMNNSRRFTVTGVFKDVPGNSHLTFDILVCYFFLEGWGGQWNHAVDWNWPEFYTYVKLAPKIDPKILEAKFDPLLEKYMGGRMKEMGFVEHLRLQPLHDIHLRSPKMAKVRDQGGSSLTVHLLLAMAFLILIIAWINYINLSTSKAVERAREVGVRKVVGAHRKQLVVQFLAESMLTNAIALGFSFMIILIVYPYFAQVSGKAMGKSVFQSGLLSELWFWISFFVIFLLGSFLAGLYPAFVLSSFKVVAVLKGKFSGSRLGLAMRSALVGFQFMISIVLIVGTMTIFKQVGFMRSKDLGYDKEQLLVIRAPHVMIDDSLKSVRKETFKTEIKRDPTVRSVTMSTAIPGKYINKVNSIRKPLDGTESIVGAPTYNVDSDFIEVYGIALVAGRNFTPNDQYLNPFDKGNPVLLTEFAAKSMGFVTVEEAVGQEIALGANNDFLATVVGIVSDFHQTSLRGGYNAILFMPSPTLIGEYITVRMDMNNAPLTIQHLETEYKRAFPGNEFDYFFLDEFFDQQYAADQQFEVIFGIFAVLSLIVTCLGLFGLSTFTISQRTKEIVIRRIFGARIINVIHLFSLDFLRLIFVANILALPIAYWFINQWLENFAFRTTLNIGIFAVPTLILAVISIATVSVQTIKSSSKNPINSLRLE